jgi:hypothetical protein
MGCTCMVSFNVGDDDELYIISEKMHYVEVMCSECKELVDHALFTLYLDIDNNPKVNVICDDCLSIRNHLFCDFPFNGLLDALVEAIDESSQDCEQFSISEECMIALTPTARGIVCDLIEEHWDKLDKKCGGGK